MMRSKSFLLAVFLLIAQFSSAQFFERIYTGLNLSYIGSLDNTIDTGFILCGNQDGAFLMKLNAGGDIEWSRTDTGNLRSTAGVIQNASGNFIVVGSGPSQFWNSEAVVASYDASGDPISDFKIPPTDGWGTWGSTITRSPDRQSSHYCYYVDGFTADNYFILDNQQTISGDMSSVGQNAITMDNNGNYYAAANLAFDMDSLFNWRNNVLVLSSNHFQRKESFYDTEISSSAITSDGGVMLAGLYDTLGTKFLRLMKFDSAADLLWSGFITDTSIFTVNQITQTTDGGYAILCGVGISNPHIAFIKIDQFGTTIWKHEFVGNGTATPKNFKILANGFVILGSTNNDPYVIRTDDLGSTNSTTNTSDITGDGSVTIYPNPSSGIFNISLKSFSSDQISLSVLDLQGRTVYNTEVNLTLQQIDLSFLAKGVYQFNFTASDKELKSSKFVIE
ncbi:MAG: T9SS type A sorting domain-containing protein [Bacteroidota bacterium]